MNTFMEMDYKIGNMIQGMTFEYANGLREAALKAQSIEKLENPYKGWVKDPRTIPDYALLKSPEIKSLTASLDKAGRNVIGEALTALDAIPATDGKIPVPWPIGKRPKLQPEQWEDSEIATTIISELTATQKTLNVETVRAYVKTPGAIEENRRAFANVYAISEGLMIVDGHHRLAALWLLGADSANVWMLGE